jgi:hypothetical protein
MQFHIIDLLTGDTCSSEYPVEQLFLRLLVWVRNGYSRCGVVGGNGLDDTIDMIIVGNRLIEALQNYHAHSLASTVSISLVIQCLTGASGRKKSSLPQSLEHFRPSQDVSATSNSHIAVSET